MNATEFNALPHGARVQHKRSKKVYVLAHPEPFATGFRQAFNAARPFDPVREIKADSVEVVQA